jgi:hypothetical protein
MAASVEPRKSVPAGTPVVKKIRGCVPCEAARAAREAAARAAAESRRQ